ncbi:MAG: hypothetical protein JO081_20080 [Alphaproteobacteria bacterium]|nr:hypothetical protein [Alphaproteobacteria bacterium]
MADNRPPHRPPFRRAGSGERFPNDRERANKARQAAEALFAPKPRENEAPNPSAGPRAERRAPARYEVLPAAVRNAPNAAPIGVAPPIGTAIPAAHAARIRTWLRYGMTVADVATVYGVGVGDIERLLREA